MLTIFLATGVRGLCYATQPRVQCAKILGYNPDPYSSLPLVDVPKPLSCLYSWWRVFTIVPNMAFLNATNSLKIIELCYCQVSSIEAQAFHGLSLTHLLLPYNQLQILPNLTEIGDSLQLLDLSYNELTTMTACEFLGLPHLEELYMTNNDLTALADPSFIGFDLKTQITVDAAYNNISQILVCENSTNPRTTQLLLSVAYNGLLSNLDAIAESVIHLKMDTMHDPCEFIKLTRLEKLVLTGDTYGMGLIPDLRVFGQGLRVSDLRMANYGFPSKVGAADSSASLAVTECTTIPSDTLNRTFSWQAGTSVDLSSNGLTILPDLSLMAEAVTDLNLDNNLLYSLPVCGLMKLINLKTLSLKYNDMYIFPPASVFGIDTGVSNMMYSCPNGGLDSIDIRRVPLLELYLDYNNIQEMNACDFMGFEHANVISMNENNVETLADVQYIGLQSPDMVSLLLDSNSLERMLPCYAAYSPPNHIRSQMTVSLASNTMTDIPEYSTASQSVTDLVLTSNSMTNLSSCFLLNFPQLTTLNMAYCDIPSAPDVSALFQNATWKVTYLNFDSTGFRNFSRCPNATEEIICASTPETQLILSRNTLDHLPNLTQISQTIINLDLGYNNIVALDSCSFQHFPNLVALNLQYNQLTSFPDASIFGYIPSNLLILNLIDNKMGDLNADAFCGFDNLEILLMNSANLTKIPDLSLVEQLKELYIDSNMISDPYIKVGESSLLNTLILSNNKLTTFPIPNRPLQYLSILLLYDNELTVINETVFLCWLDRMIFTPSDFFGEYFQHLGPTAWGLTGNSIRKLPDIRQARPRVPSDTSVFIIADLNLIDKCDCTLLAQEILLDGVEYLDGPTGNMQVILNTFCAEPSAVNLTYPQNVREDQLALACSGNVDLHYIYS